MQPFMEGQKGEKQHLNHKKPHQVINKFCFIYCSIHLSLIVCVWSRWWTRARPFKHWGGGPHSVLHVKHIYWVSDFHRLNSNSTSTQRNDNGKYRNTATFIYLFIYFTEIRRELGVLQPPQGDEFHQTSIPQVR